MLRFRDSLVKSSYKNQIQKFSDRKKAKSLRRDLKIFESDKTRFIIIVRNLVRNLKVGDRTDLMDWQKNFLITCAALPKLFDELQELYPEVAYILTTRLLQDALENLFGRLRYLAGNDKRFGSLTFRRLLRTLILGGDDIPISGHS